MLTDKDPEKERTIQHSLPNWGPIESAKLALRDI